MTRSSLIKIWMSNEESWPPPPPTSPTSLNISAECLSSCLSDICRTQEKLGRVRQFWFNFNSFIWPPILLDLTDKVCQGRTSDLPSVPLSDGNCEVKRRKQVIICETWPSLLTPQWVVRGSGGPLTSIKREKSLVSFPGNDLSLDFKLLLMIKVIWCDPCNYTLCTVHRSFLIINARLVKQSCDKQKMRWAFQAFHYQPNSLRYWLVLCNTIQQFM